MNRREIDTQVRQCLEKFTIPDTPRVAAVSNLVVRLLKDVYSEIAAPNWQCSNLQEWAQKRIQEITDSKLQSQ